MAILTTRILIERLVNLTSNCNTEVLEQLLIPALNPSNIECIRDKVQNKEAFTAEDHEVIKKFVAECVIGSVAVLVVLSPDTTPNTLADAIDKQLKAKEIRACKATQNKL